MDFAALAQTLGLPLAALVFLAWSGARRWWAFGWVHEQIVAGLSAQLEDVTADRDFWRSEALRGTDLAERVVDHVERSATGGPPTAIRGRRG